MDTSWIKTEIAKGLQGLLCLSLERQPANELIEGTLAMWLKVITNNRVFDRDLDAPRFRAAFLSLAERSTWPAPTDFIAALPDRAKPKLAVRIESEDARKRNLARLAEIAEKLFPSSREDAA